MKSRRYAFLATTALVGSLAMGACTNDNNVLAPQEVGPFGLPVGEPIDVISATRGEGVSFDKFQVTFNDAAGTDITITTPEGEEINFTEGDLEWAGEDEDLGGMPIAKFTSSRGDRVDVVIGSASVPVPPPPVDEVAAQIIEEPTTEPVAVVALGRLDEVDTREGFESYGVIGQEADSGALPRYQEDVILLDGEGTQVAAGELAKGSAWYYSDHGLLASVFKEGELVTDSVSGWAQVEIDFAANSVNFDAEGSYVYDDVDDVMQGSTITGIVKTWGSFVASVDPSTASALTGFDTTTGTFVTGITAEQALALTGFDTTSGQFVTSVGAASGTIAVGDQIGEVDVGGPGSPNVLPVFSVIGTDYVIAVNPETGTALTGISGTSGTFLTALNPPTTGDAITDITADDGLFVTAVNPTSEAALTDVTVNMVTDTDNVYQLQLSGSGSAGDLGFDGGVRYSGDLSGSVEIPETEAVWVNNTQLVDEEGAEFAGAVYGSGADAETVDAGNMDNVVAATATAGVFEIDSGVEDDGSDPQVQVVGGYVASGHDDFDEDPFVPADAPQ